MLAEVLEPFDHLVIKPLYRPGRGVAKYGQDLRCVPDMRACLIFVACLISYLTRCILRA